MTAFNAYAATSADGALAPFSYDPGPLGVDDVEIQVESCGICHSDLSMMRNEWGMTSYPFVPGHEAIGTIVAKGDLVTTLDVGQRVGLGWSSRSCLGCRPCLSGDHNMCNSLEQTIVGRHGAFADRVRAQASWCLPLPDGLDAAKAGPLFCGGITVFHPLIAFGVKPTDRVGVIGIGGLGHMALKMLRAWGCEVWAFTSSDAKAEEARGFGAHHTANTRDTDRLQQLAGTFDFIISTVNVPLDWADYINALAPKGRLHNVGAVVEKPLEIPAFGLIVGQRSVSGSPTGSPSTMALMLDFCARHDIAPQTETFKMADCNDAMAHLEAGKARYRIVLEN